MRRASLALSSAAVLLALGLTGCGGDDGDSADAPSSESTSTASTPSPAETETTEATEEPADGGGLSKEDFLAQANAICSGGNQVIEAASALVDTGDPAAVDNFAKTVLVPSVRAQVAAIRALSIPAADEEMLAGVLDDADAALDEIEADPSLLTGEDSPFTAVNEALSGYGLTDCAS